MLNLMFNKTKYFKRIDGVMVTSVLASRVVERGFKLRLGQTKDYKTGIYCFSTNTIIKE